MRGKNNNFPDGLKELVPVIVFCIAMAAIICIPLRVMSYGFIPPDDAGRHAAKVISGKSWDEILVVRPEFKMDSHPGWHAILQAIHRISECDQDTLVFFSVVFLFILFCIIPIFFLDFPEAWLASILAFVVLSPNFIFRLFLGRPYIFTMTVILAICFIWPRLKDKKIPYIAMGILTALIAMSTWIHASWYLFALPIACFFIAREVRVGTRLAIATVIGVIVGASVTGHPYMFLKQTLTHMMFAFGGIQSRRLLVGEFQPFAGESLVVLFMLIIALWRKVRGKWDPHTFHDPIFILAVTGWALGFVATRFWTDWGMPAAIFWIMVQINDFFNEKVDATSLRRVFIASAISGILFLAVSADIDSRWTRNLIVEYLSSEDPKQAEWLPEPGGIIYSDDMTVFYQTFFKNPKAPWRYMLGFEPAMMPAEDLATLRRIHWNFESRKAFDPWVSKMGPKDRLIIRASQDAKPAISGLEWYYAATGTWIGRIPKH
ncbi:MAG: hypothetical protein WCY36_03580 [Candidatus Omnitrophota bacterium]